MLRRETAGDPARMRQALQGLRAYQEADREAMPPALPAIAERHGAALRDYGGGGAPVVFVPSLINPPNVLDLGGGRSLLRWLAGRGHRVLLVDWGWEARARRDLSVAGHVEEILLPLIEGLDEPPSLVGYCLGGTMALAAAQLVRAASLALVASPWHFSAFPPASRDRLEALWRNAGATAEAIGVLPMEIVQSAFWSLDPARTVAKFEAFAAMPPESAEARAFVALEDWANDGPPLPVSAARELFAGFFRDDAPGTGRWRVGGVAIDPAALACPVLSLVSTTDRIVPHATSVRTGRRISLDQGHVGMVVGRRARETLWEPLAGWLSQPRGG